MKIRKLLIILLAQFIFFLTIFYFLLKLKLLLGFYESEILTIWIDKIISKQYFWEPFDTVILISIKPFGNYQFVFLITYTNIEDWAHWFFYFWYFS